MPCRGPCGIKEDGTTNYEWGSPEAGCHLDDGHDGPHSWEDAYKRRKHAEMIDVAGQTFTQARVTVNQLLCSACRTLERMGYDMDENPALSQWWENHKGKDDAGT